MKKNVFFLLSLLLAAGGAYAIEFEVLDKLAVTGSAVFKSSVTVNAIALPAVSPAAAGTLYFDSTLNKFRVSQNAGNYVNLIATGTANYLPKFTGDTVPNLANSLVFENGTNVGIADASPASLFTVGNGDLFQVDLNGNIVKLKNLTYDWPASHVGADTFLRNNGAGGLTWQAVSGDNLGNHTAALALNMNNKAVDNVSSMTITGVGVTGTNPVFKVAGSTMVVLNNGNVGIGTANPAMKLHIIDSLANQPSLGVYTTGDVYQARFRWDSAGVADLGTFSNHPLRFLTNSTERVRIDTSGNVGIGTTNPTEKLLVSGGNIGINRTSADYNVLSMTNSSGVQVHLNANGNSEGNLRTVTNHPLSFSTNNTQRMVIDTSGKVGIGITSPTEKLEVDGGYIRSSFNGGGIYPSYGAGSWLNMGGNFSEGQAEANIWNSYSGGDAYLRGFHFMQQTGAGSYRTLMRLLGTGNVGIGTTGPNAKLEIKGNEATTSTTFEGLQRFTDGSDVVIGQIYRDYSGSSEYLGIEGSSSKPLVLQEFGGNVGIGMIPYQKLDVYTTTSNDGVFVRGNATSGYTIRARIAANMTAGSNNGIVQTGDMGIVYEGVDIGNLNGFFIAPWMNGTTGIRLDSAGNVGIGRSLPQSVLHLEGAEAMIVGFDNDLPMSASRPAWAYGASGSTFLINSTGTYSGAPNGWANRLAIDANGKVGIATASPGYTLTVNGTAWVTSGAWTGSDRRWKKDISPLSGSLGKIMKLQGVNYNWKTDEYPELNFSSAPQVGLIAQDTEIIVPEAVTTDNNGYKGISYEKLVPLLIEAVKEQQVQIEDLKARLVRVEKGGP